MGNVKSCLLVLRKIRNIPTQDKNIKNLSNSNTIIFQGLNMRINQNVPATIVPAINKPVTILALFLKLI
jgi:hypothetical protein